MDYTISTSADKRIANMNGRLTFQEHAQFRKLMEELFAERVGTYTFNLSGLEFVDSAGLGMLLLGKDRADKGQGKVVLQAPPAQVKRVLTVAQFENIFDITD